MKFAMLLCFLCLFPQFIMAIEPPIDILNLDFVEFTNEHYEDLELENGYLRYQAHFNYFGTRISYSVDFEKDNLGNFYIFFYRPYSDLDNFIEFYADMLDYYSELSDLVYFKDDFDLNESEPQFTFYINNNYPLLIYRKESMDSGFRGFGITFNLGQEYQTVNSTWIYWQNLFDSELRYLESMNIDYLTDSTAFVSGDIITTELTFSISSSDFASGNFFREMILMPNSTYNISVDGLQAIENLENISIIRRRERYNYEIINSNPALSTFTTSDYPEFLVFLIEDFEESDINLTISINIESQE